VCVCVCVVWDACEHSRCASTEEQTAGRVLHTHHFAGLVGQADVQDAEVGAAQVDRVAVAVLKPARILQG